MKAIFICAETEYLCMAVVLKANYCDGEMILTLASGEKRCCPMGEEKYRKILFDSIGTGVFYLQDYYFRVDYHKIYILNAESRKRAFIVRRGK